MAADLNKNSGESKQDESAAPISSPEHLSSSSSSTSSLPSSERLYKPPSSSAPTSSSTKDSSSPADTILDRDRDIQSESIGPDFEPDEPRTGSHVHGHILPTGWVCTYDSDNDQYMFEYQGDREHHRESVTSSDKPTLTSVATIKMPMTAITGSTTTFCRKHSTKDEAILVKTPTADHDVQTSRRPTLNRFECQYGYHFPASPTPSMLSDLARQVSKNSGATSAPKTKQLGYGKSKLTMLTDEAEQAKRLKEMFPTATGPIVDQMIRIFHGREGIIKAALISQGYKRAVDYNVQQEAALSPIMLMMTKPESKKLFEKLIGYFPGADEAFIKGLMYKHRGVEHEIISAIVESGQLAKKADKSSKTRSEGHSKFHHEQDYEAIMRLRYLKSFFPTCDEREIYHLLYRCNLNLQKVKEIMEQGGHKGANLDEVLKTRNEQTKQMRAKQAASAAKDKEPVVNQVEAHKNRPKPTITESRVNDLKENLKKVLPDFEDGLLLSALEATDYNEPLAKKFIQEMEPIDESLYTQRYEIRQEQQPDVIMYPCKSSQIGGTSLMSAIDDDYVAIPREVVDCENALALLKVDACTFTQDDFIEPRLTHARGKRLDLALGSIFKSLDVKESLRRGASEALRSGSNYEQIRTKKKLASTNRASVRDKPLAQGRKPELRSGHNQVLVQRPHPFFEEPRSRRINNSHFVTKLSQ